MFGSSSRRPGVGPPTPGSTNVSTSPGVGVSRGGFAPSGIYRNTPGTSSVLRTVGSTSQLLSAANVSASSNPATQPAKFNATSKPSSSASNSYTFRSIRSSALNTLGSPYSSGASSRSTSNVSGQGRSISSVPRTGVASSSAQRSLPRVLSSSRLLGNISSSPLSSVSPTGPRSPVRNEQAGYRPTGGGSTLKRLANEATDVSGKDSESPVTPPYESTPSSERSSSQVEGFVPPGDPRNAGLGLSPHGFVQKERLSFKLSDLSMSTTVGEGSFGRVRIVKYKPFGTWYALKIMKKHDIVKLRQVEHIKSEVSILNSVFHPFIVNLLGHLQDEKKLYLLFEYVPGGELFSYLRQENTLSESSTRFYAAEILLAFEYLHSLSIVYRDLKPENILLTAKGHVKITDFGFAKIVRDRTYTLCGTPEYLAPEIIQSKGHDKGVDWWALGILIYEMLAGYPPFLDDTPYVIYQKILAGHIEWPSHFSPEVRDLIRKLLNGDRTRRLGSLRGGAYDVKMHPWFSSCIKNWDYVYSCGYRAPYIPRVSGADDTSNFDSYPESDDDSDDSLEPIDDNLFRCLDVL